MSIIGTNNLSPSSVPLYITFVLVLEGAIEVSSLPTVQAHTFASIKLEGRNRYV